ncbi:MerR family DNA-binding transcriptional regulator [Priestia megaterium]
MTYTISQVAKKLNVTIYTIRYYDKEGLFHF